MRKHTHRLLNLGVVIAMVLMAVSPTVAWAAPSYTSQLRAAASTVREPTIAIQLSAEDYRAAPALSPNYVVDYGSFVWLEIPAKQLSRLEASGLAYQRGETTIGSYNFKFDPLEGTPSVPSNLQTKASATEPGLYLIQFIGPINDHWLADASKSGIKLLQYYAHNAYLAWSTGTQLERLESKSYVRWSGVFQPAYKLNPNLNSLNGRIENVAITFYNDGDIERTLDAFTGMGGEVIQAFPAQPDKAFYTAIVTLDANRLVDAAQLSTVWAMDYSSPKPGLDDELATQNVAGNFSGGAPVVGYYDWLTSKGVNGNGVTWADVDTGLNSTHPDLTGRAIAFVSYPGAGAANVDTDGHGTHTAGAIMADGRGGTGIQDPNGFYWGTGMAPSSTLVVQNAIVGTNWPPTGGWQLLSKDSVTNGALGSSNSWYTGNYSNDYTAACRTHDLMVRDANFDTTTVAEPIIYIFSAGNGGPNYSTLSEPHASKNPVTVAAASNYPRSAASINDLAYFSSRGPATDGRLLPSVAAPGYETVSLNGSGSATCGTTVSGAGAAYYNYCSGTSMAAPLVAGASALIVDWWKQLNSGAVPSPAMVKALLINGANDMVGGNRAAGGTAGVIGNIPNNDEGWGRVNLNNVIRTGVPSLYYDQQTVLGATGETWQKTLTVADPTKPVKISLVWTDAAGAAGANPALVNDLNLTVVNGGNTYRGNNFAGGWSTISTTVDSRNNLENIYLSAGATGSLQITIAGANIAGDGIPYNADTTDQDFALVVYNARADGGAIAGTITEADSDPIVGAKVTAFQNITETTSATSGAGGLYAMFVPTGTYGLEAAAYGYLPAQRSGVEVTLNTTTTQNFSLTVAANYVISGTVTDSATGYPLGATITVDGEDFDPPVASVQTNPATGYYTLTVAGGQAYTLTVAALLHTSQIRGIGTPTGNQTQDFALAATTTNGGLIGWVRNYYTNDPISNATVTIDATGNPSDQTDANGYFEIFNLAPGTYTATATADLYSPVSIGSIEVLTSNIAVRTFLLPTSHLAYDPAALEQTITFGSTITDNAGLVITNTGVGALTFELQETSGGFAPLRSLGPAYLVVGTMSSSNRSITQSLTALGYTYQITTESAFNTLPVTNLLPYRAVIYASNSSTGLPKLVSYLDNGGRLLIADNDVGYTNGSSVFYRQYLEAQYGGDDATNGAGTVVGEDIMNGLSAGITDDPYPDYYTITGTNTTRIFVYSTAGPGNNGPAGSRTTRNGYQVVYLPFDFYYLGTSAIGEPIEADVLQRALNWLGGTTYDAIPWITETPISGTLTQNNAQNIQLVWDASNPSVVVQPGVYTGSLKINNNDPLAQSTVLPVTMNVQPTATQGKLAGVVTSLGYCDANAAPLVGANVVIQNAGGFTQTLTTNAAGQYEWWLDSVGNAYTVTVSHPAHLGNSAVVNVVAGVTTTHDVTLRWSQPCISAAPNSLNATLAQGLSTTLPITLGNNGAAALTFDIREAAGGFLPVEAGEDVLVVRHDSTAADAMQAALTAGGYTYLGVTDAQFQALTVADLLNYRAVFHAGTTGTGSTPGASENLLLAYLDAGGNLFIADNDLGYYRGSSPFYTTYLQGTYVSDDPGINTINGQDIMSGLTLDISGDSYPDDFTVGAQGVRIFQYTGGNAAGDRVARNGYKAVYLSFDFQYLTALSDRTEVVRRIMNFFPAADVTWLSEVPITGTIAPAGNQLVDVTFDASVPEITQPGTYTATLRVVSNDPINGLYNIPVTMNVTPLPGLGKLMGVVTTTGYCDVNPAPLAGANVFIQGSGGYTQSLTTGGDGSYQWWLDSVQSPYTVTVSALNHPTTEAVVTISAGVTTTQNFVLRLQQPCVVPDPTSFNVNVELGANTTRPLTLTNNGAVPLNYLLLENQPWLSTLPVSGTTAPDGGTSAIVVTFDAGVPEITQPGTYTTTLTVQSNDPVNGNYPLPVSMVVTPPNTYGVLTGTITGLQHCDAAGGPLANAQVLVQSAGGLTWTVTSNASGLYNLWLNQGAYTVTVSASGYATSAPVAVNISAQATTTQDMSLRLSEPCVSAAPLSLEATVALGGNQVTTLTLSNQGAAASLFGMEEVPGTPVVETTPNEASPDMVVTTGPALATAETGIASGDPVFGPPSSLVAPEDIGTAWETMAPLPSARVFNAVVAAGNYVYVIAGTSDAGGSTSTNTNYRYGTATNTWDTMATIPVALNSIDGIAINGKIYIPGDATTATTYVYDIAGNSWTTIAASGGYTARSQYQVVALGTKLYVLGGIIASASASTTEVWVLETSTGVWTAGVPMQKSRTSFSAAALNGQIYVAGGVAFPGFTPDMTSEKFNGTAWSYIADVPNGSGAYTRWSYNADAVGPQGLWLAAGRRDTGWAVLNHAGYYDPNSNTWTDSPTIPALAQGRVYMEGDVAADGYFYVIGGRDSAGAIVYANNERLLVGTSTPAAADTVPWLAEVPLTGTVSADSNFPVQITFTALPTMTTGVYTATLRVNSQDSVHRSIAVPVTMTIIAPAVCGFTSSSPDDVGQTTIFTNTTTGSEPLTYRWNFGDNSPLSAATSPTHTYAQVGVYTVIMTATNAYGDSVCSNPVSIEGVPLASFTSNSPVALGQQAVFTNTTIANPAVSSWLWNFGDPASGTNTSTLMNPTHLYAATGTYTVTLTATNARGSNVYTSIVSVFVPGWKLYLPIVRR